MSSHQLESFNVRFTGKNYSSWEFQFQLFVTGKELWGHIDGSEPAPTDAAELRQWKVKDARVMTWILGSMDPLIVVNLRPYKTAKDMWDYLQKVYNQDNSARRFQLEHEIANYSQGNLSVQDYFSGFQNLWAEFTDIVYAKIPAESLSVIQAVHEQSKRDQFLMKLRYDFEGVRSNLMHRDPSPSLDVCFRELLREEQRLVTQSTFKQENQVTVAFAAQGKGKSRDMTKMQCYSCKEYGHIAINCGRKFCNYCKQQGHIIKECPTRPQNRRVNAFQAGINGFTSDTLSSAGLTNQVAAPVVSPSPSTTSAQVLTPEMVQQMIVSAFSALGLQGKKLKMAGHSDKSEKGERSNHVVSGRPSDEDRNVDNLVGGASGDNQDSAPGTSSKKRKYIRHTAEQVFELEAAFKENQNPDNKTIEELANKMGMGNKQVKVWFQNRKMLMKLQSEKHENGLLRKENDELRSEKITLVKAMRNPVCNQCGRQAILAQVNHKEHEEKLVHERLKQEVESITLLAKQILGPLASLAISGSAFDGGINSVETQLPMGIDSNNDLPSPLPVTPQQPTASLVNVDVAYDKSKLMDLAVAAMSELLKLAEIGEPLWVRSLNGGGETLSVEEYVRSFTPCIDMEDGNFITEATKACAIVIINSLTLVETLMDGRRWVEMFSCNVGKTSVADVISSCSVGSWSGTLTLIKTEFQILSDMVPARKVKFLRFCKQHAEGLWAVVDVSVDSIQEGSKPGKMRNCKRLPSGCIIQDMPNGYSKVTWIEHMEYDESFVHHLYRPLVKNGLGFGAQRWMATLQRMSELMSVMISPVDATGDHAVVCSSGRRSIAMLAQRMARSFCGGVCATLHKWVSIREANGEDAKLTMRRNMGEPGELTGVILSATKTIWLPVKQHHLIEFLLDKEKRSQWDVLSDSYSLKHMVDIAKGQNLDNRISLFRADTLQQDDTNADQNSKMILQDTSSDATGFLLVYAKVDTSAMNVVMDGGDSSSVTFLPSGISIVPDCFHDYSSASNSTGTSHGISCTGSLVTIGIQILANSLPTAKLKAESGEEINDLIARTVEGIKAAFGQD